LNLGREAARPARKQNNKINKTTRILAMATPPILSRGIKSLRGCAIFSMISWALDKIMIKSTIGTRKKRPPISVDLTKLDVDFIVVVFKL
jgi:hypothetical protein